MHCPDQRSDIFMSRITALLPLQLKNEFNNYLHNSCMQKLYVRKKYAHVKQILCLLELYASAIKLLFQYCRYLQPICIAPYIFVPEISIVNLDKIASVYPRLAAIPARFNTA